MPQPKSPTKCGGAVPYREPMHIKILMIGDENVGKTSIVNSIDGAFSRYYEPTKDVESSLVTKTYGRPVHFEIVDAGQQAKYVFLPLHRDMYVKTTDVFVFCFDLTDPMSLKNTNKYFEMIPEICFGCANPVFLVGCKADLKTERKIPQKTIQAMVEQWGCGYIEISSKKRQNIDELFFQIYLKVEAYREAEREKAKSVSSRVTRAVRSYFNFMYSNSQSNLLHSY